MTVSLFLYLGIYSALLLLITFFISRKNTEEDFLIAGRKRTWWEVLFSKYVAEIDASWFVAFVGFAYFYGLGILGILFGTLVGYVLFASWGAPKIRNATHQHTFYTQGDFVSSKTGSAYAGQVTNWIAALNTILWLLVGIVGGAKIIEFFGLASYEVALAITILVIFSYLIIGGLRAVILTDVIQAIILIGLLAIISFGIIGDTNVGTLLSIQTDNLGLFDFVAFLLFGLLAPFSAPDRYQLVYAGKNTKEVATGLNIAFVPVLVSALFLLFIGLFMLVQSPGLEPGFVFSEALSTYLAPELLPLGVLLFFVALMSSADTNIYSAATHLLLKTNVAQKTKRVRWGLVALALLSFVIGIFIQDIIHITILAGIATFLAAIPLIYLISGGTQAAVFFGGISGGVLGAFWGIIIFGLEPTVGGVVVLGALVGLATPYLYLRFKK